jgi:hypothetical protein
LGEHHETYQDHYPRHRPERARDCPADHRRSICTNGHDRYHGDYDHRYTGSDHYDDGNTDDDADAYCHDDHYADHDHHDDGNANDHHDGNDDADDDHDGNHYADHYADHYYDGNHHADDDYADDDYDSNDDADDDYDADHHNDHGSPQGRHSLQARFDPA